MGRHKGRRLWYTDRVTASFHDDRYPLHITYRSDVPRDSSRPSLVETRLPLPDELGESDAWYAELGNGLSCGTLYVRGPLERLTLTLRSAAGRIELTMHVSPRPKTFGIGGLSERLAVTQGEGYFIAAQAEGVFEFDHGEELREFSLFVSESLLAEVADDLQSSAAREITAQLLRCPLRGNLRRLYIEAKLLDLLSLRLHELRRAAGHALKPHFDSRDRRNLEEARDILRREAFEPPSIRELARRVGLNTTKLKVGFRSLYRATPFGYVREVRLGRALDLLTDGDFSVGEVAAAVGYSSMSSFAEAFRRRHGFLPKTVRESATKVSEGPPLHSAEKFLTDKKENHRR